MKTKDFNLSTTKLFNLKIITIFSFLFFLIAAHVDFMALVDTVFYLEALEDTHNFLDVLDNSHRWGSDIGYIIFSYLISLFSNGYMFSGFLIVTTMYLLLLFSTLPYIDSRYYVLLLLMLLFSFTFIGLFFNVWRQGFSQFLILLSIVYKDRLFYIFRVLALTFHAPTAIFFLYIPKFKKFKTAALIISFTLVFISLLGMEFIISLSFPELMSVVEVYREAKSTAPIIRYVYAIFLFLSFTLFHGYFSGKDIVVSSQFYNLIILILFVGFLFLYIMPAASERFMHYFYLIIPFYFIDVLMKVNKKVRLYTLLFIFFHVSIMMILMTASNSWSLVISSFKVWYY